MRGDLLRIANDFKCRQCDGTIQEADLAEYLMVDGETYKCVKCFCYLETLLMERILLLSWRSGKRARLTCVQLRVRASLRANVLSLENLNVIIRAIN